ncbi:MAG: c-type cytochrome [Rhodospirillaceae bacterium]|nr:c-type cytochrome [Rhodospirillaceae bacterium]MBT5245108.1 c-type cytochrome [Rhodospirillaceae bacterium]MBT5562027.1 c-type cytochrome [Rhodospirillaceae bacterium]MBT6242200.1 c-type cytochrome [Rhodospirillaceae bacterium]MBT7136669.1 c-type cytochrome [Rhodospirillaceae bacterium]
MMTFKLFKGLAFVALIAGTITGGPSVAAPGDVENGEKIYMKRCVWCHGEEGEGDGPAGDLLVPPPRDFTGGLYKIITTPFDEDFPNDADLFRMISDGMPGTDMPGWKDILKDEQDRWDLVAYIKAFAELEEEPGVSVDYGTQVATSEASIAKGKELFHEGDRCSECHGQDGKGDGIKKLKGDNGERTWPRNLTKPWTFRGSNDPKDIFTRVSTGIPGTQMPSFANPKSKVKLSVEDRWNVANYVQSLAKTDKVVAAENTVVKANRIEGDVPSDPNDPAWDTAELTTFMMVPQIFEKERVFTYSNDTITLSAFYNETELAMMLEWDDRTRSIPGDPDIDKIADKVPFEDMISVQLPVTIPEGTQKPYFINGDTNNPVNLLTWRSGTSETPQSVSAANATGSENIEERDAANIGLVASSAYKDGTWRVVMKRPLSTSNAESDLQLVEGRFIPIAFANWDGSNSETGTKHTRTTWYWLLLKPADSAKPYILALIVAGIIFGGLVWWAKSAAKDQEV